MTAQRSFAAPLDVPASRIDLVLSEIRSAILTRRIQPGEQLVESELAKVFGVSKTPVREALKILSSSGLVTFKPYKGASVRSVDKKYVRDVYDLRLLLEPEAVKRSTANISADELDAAAALLDRAQAAGEAEDWAELSLLNRSFHASLYAYCGSELLIDVLDNLRDRAALISVAGWESTPTWEKEWDEHRTMLGTIRERKSDIAAELSRQHILDFFNQALPHFPETGE